MKYCEKCGKELFDEAVLCVGCGCPVGNGAYKNYNKPKDTSLDQYVWDAGTTNVIALLLLLAGAVLGLFVEDCGYIGAVVCLVAELVALIPNTKFQKEVKGIYWKLPKSEMKYKAKQSQQSLKSRYPSYRFSFIIAYIALVLMIVLVSGVHEFLDLPKIMK